MAESILDDIFSGSDGVARSLISLLGGDATITQTSAPTYNPLTDTATPIPTTPVPVDISVLEQVSEREINETTVVRGDYRCLMPSDVITLTRDNINHTTITFNGTVYKLVEYKPVYSGQLIAMYTLYLRNT